MTKIEELVEQLGKLTVLEAGELAKKLEEAWGVTAEMGIVAVAAPSDAQTQEESSNKTVTLKGFPADKKMTVLKTIKDILGLGLMEAKTFVESVPNVVKSDLPKEEADELGKKLQEAGAELEIK